MHIDRSNIHPKKRVLSVFTLVMINVIAVDSLRSLTISANYGLSLIFYYLLAALIFFIPIALISAELATGWPRVGGLYVWVREAFGKRWGFFAIWLQWIYNIVWFPTILSFVSGTLAYLIEPSLAENKTYMVSTILVAFWIATLVNCFGMRISGIISTLGAIFGTLLPMFLIIGLAATWLMTGHPSNIEFSTHNLIPTFTSLNQSALFIGILFGLLGIEMSAVHAEDVKNPQRDYPKALLISGSIIVVSLIFSSLAIAIVVPHDQIKLVSGLVEAFEIFFNAFHIAWMSKIVVFLIIFGATSSVSAWIIGPAKGLLAAADDGCVPRFLEYSTSKGVPIALLMVQGLIFTTLCLIFIFMPTVNSSYWILSALTAQLSMFVYVFLFAAAIKLRYSQPSLVRAFRVPGGKPGIWLTGLIGILTCSFAIFIGFFPPPEIEIGNIYLYETILVFGICFFCIMALLLYRADPTESQRP